MLYSVVAVAAGVNRCYRALLWRAPDQKAGKVTAPSPLDRRQRMPSYRQDQMVERHPQQISRPPQHRIPHLPAASGANKYAVHLEG